MEIEAIILDTLTKTFPANPQQPQSWEKLNEMVLADPKFFQPDEIDIILGADVLHEILRDGVMKQEKGLLAQETELGWVLSGKSKTSKQNANEITSFVVTKLEKQVQQFFDAEELNQEERKMTKQEQQSENIFQNTHSRDESGRYVIRLPFKDEKIPLGKSRATAVARLFQLENQFEKRPEMKAKYVQCINEYLQLGHMKRATQSEENFRYKLNGNEEYKCYYTPCRDKRKQQHHQIESRIRRFQKVHQWLFIK